MLFVDFSFFGQPSSSLSNFSLLSNSILEEVRILKTRALIYSYLAITVLAPLYPLPVHFEMIKIKRRKWVELYLGLCSL